ncbi:MAG: class I tRNA ligase family protein [Minisyncoccia bacterium]
MKEYDHKKIEKKWQTFWQKKGTFNAPSKSKKPKYYSLIEFPYPSGAGLHVGHIRSNTAMDIISRKRRMEGFNVLYPIGWDAFGLPTENYAIKSGIHPIKVTKDNTNTFRRQLKSLGFSFDWSREVNTTDPKYYKWTQWIFLQFFKKDLAYKTKTEINWCPSCKIGLANEEVVGGMCERCGGVTEKREKEQWMLAITKYAERLDKDLDTVDYLPKIKIQQRNWIGKSEGAEIDFKIVSSVASEEVKVFTTRPDTIFGATYLVLAPEHGLVQKLQSQIKNWEEVKNYLTKVKKTTEIERTSEDKIKTGVELKGIKAINPGNKEEISVWIADYVLPHYGTGAIMAVPAHDERDFEFAKKYNLPIRQVVMPNNLDGKNPPQEGKENTKRNVVHVILRNPKNETVLLMFLKGEEWKGAKPVNFIIGGIEEGEREIDAAIREVKEETGYINIKFVEQIPFKIQARFFAAHKNVNRVVNVQTLVFDLMGEEKVDITEDEFFSKSSHEMKWIAQSKVLDTLTIPDDKMAWEYYQATGFAYGAGGILINSGKFNGLDSEESKKEIIKFVGGKEKTTFKLRDWVFSRQRYWGEPIPLIFCDKPASTRGGSSTRGGCGFVPVPDKDLPVILPKVAKYKPTDNGESPLADIKSWVNVRCPKCKGPAKRETDTMPNWAGSSWYFLRYTDPKNNKEFASKKNLGYFMKNGVDWYNGGMEHTTLHLLYSRFWHKFLYDLKLVPTSEPYMKRTSHGMILAEAGEKMSKSKGNTVNPDDLIKTFGADTLRMYEMFMGPFDQSVSWNTDSMVGPRRFLERVWKIGVKISATRKIISPRLTLPGIPGGTYATEKLFSTTLEKLLHKTIKKVSEDIEEMRFNTAISSMMVLVNEMEKNEITKDDFKKFLQILSPFAPHIAEELWSVLGEKKSINSSSWPKWDKAYIQDEQVKVVIQVNGKLRAEITIDANDSEENVKKQALSDEAIIRFVKNSAVKKVIYVKNRLINIVL